MWKRLPVIILTIILSSLILTLYIFNPGFRFSLLIKPNYLTFNQICKLDSLITSLINLIALPYHHFKLNSYLYGYTIGDIIYLVTQTIQFILLYKLIILPTRVLSFPLKLLYSFKKNIYQNIVIIISVIALPLIFTYPIIYYQNNYFYLYLYFWPLLILFILIGAVTKIVELREYLNKLSKEKNKRKQENMSVQYLKSDRADIKLKKESNNYIYVKRLFSMIEKLNSNSDFYSIALNGSWGTGKTIILYNLKKELELNRYEVIWLNAWQLKSANNLIEELERAILKFCKKSLYFVPQEFYTYFELLNQIHSNKTLEKVLSTALNWMKKETFEESMRVTKELIERALEAAHKKKLIFIFDDIDRILEREESVNLLKTIRYVTNFENSIAISGLDMEVVGKVIGHNNSLEGASFLNKIFNLVLELYSKNEQYELTAYLRSEWDLLKKVVLEEELQLNAEEFAGLDELIISGKLYDIFHNYREVKLTLNDFIGHITIMQNLADKVKGKVSANINLEDIFIMSILKTLAGDFYQSFLNYIKKSLYKLEGSFINIIEEYLNNTLTIQSEAENQTAKFSFKGDKDYRIFSIFKLSGFEILPNKISEPTKINFKGNENNRLSLISSEAFRYYITPIIRQYQFSVREMALHIDRLSALLTGKEDNYGYEIKKAIINTVHDKRKSLNKGFSHFEFLGMINDYLDKCYGLLLSNKLEEEKPVELYKLVINIMLSYAIHVPAGYFPNDSGELKQDFFNRLFRPEERRVYDNELFISQMLMVIKSKKRYLPYVVEPLFKVYSDLYQADEIGQITNEWLLAMNKAGVTKDIKLTILFHFYKTGTERDINGNFTKYFKTIYAEIRSLNIKDIIESNELRNTVSLQLFDLLKYTLKNIMSSDSLEQDNFIKTLYDLVDFFLDYFKSGPNSSTSYYLLCKEQIALSLTVKTYEIFETIKHRVSRYKIATEALLRDNIRESINHLQELFKELTEGYNSNLISTSERAFIEKAQKRLTNNLIQTETYNGIIMRLNHEFEGLDRPELKGPIDPRGTPPNDEE